MFSPFHPDHLHAEMWQISQSPDENVVSASLESNFIILPTSERMKRYQERHEAYLKVHNTTAYNLYDIFVELDVNKTCRIDMFQLFLNVFHFKPEEIEAKVFNGCIVVHAKHEERFDDHGCIDREFTRRYEVHKDAVLSSIKAVYKRNGILEIGFPIIPKFTNEKWYDETIEIEIQKCSEGESMEEMAVDKPVDIKDSIVEKYVAEYFPPAKDTAVEGFVAENYPPVDPDDSSLEGDWEKI